MPYKREYHTFRCPECGIYYQVLTPAYKRKMKDKQYGALCKSCRARIQMLNTDIDHTKKPYSPKKARVKIKSEKRKKTEKELPKEFFQGPWVCPKELECRKKRLTNPSFTSEQKNGRTVLKPVQKDVGESIDHLHKQFVEYFHMCVLRNDYTLRYQLPLTKNEYTYIWDYGVYDKNFELSSVVDLDYKSHPHLDEGKRGLSVPKGIRICIIEESRFTQTFSWFVKQTIVDYDTYIDTIFHYFRVMPFPLPSYSNQELISSWNRLDHYHPEEDDPKQMSIQSRTGDRLVSHFHPSIWRAHRVNEPSPFDAWKDDKMFRACIENRIIYQPYLSAQKILQGFNITKKAPKVSAFAPSRAKCLIYKYLNEFDTIFDPFSGFSGRMLGCLAMNKVYYGQDISMIHVNETNQMYQFLKEHHMLGNQTDGTKIIQKDILNSYGTYPCLFTCPPYGDKEQWLDVEPSTKSCDDWIDICLKHFQCKKYLFVVDITEKWKDHIVDTIGNRSHFGKNTEHVVLITN